MKRNAIPGNKGSSISSCRHQYTKVRDNRKHPIRGLWRRHGGFIARITVENEAGRKKVRWVPMAAQTTAEAQEEFRKLLVERTENRPRHIGRSPTYLEFYDQTYLPMLAASGKKPDTITTEKTLVCIGADADTKNREARHLDFNPALEAHLREMFERRAPDSQWLFPSPQRGERDEHARTFRESRKLARQAAGLNAFCFHDCRHHFISFAVMSGIDYVTIARWVGHKDGGVLIGKVYGHLCNKHTQAQAPRLNFGPTVLPLGALPTLAANAVVAIRAKTNVTP